MIVTRQRKQKRNNLPILLPVAAIAMLVVALSWPPSRNFISNGPLHPVAVVVGNVWSNATRPLSFAYQQQQITDRNVQVRQLNDKLESDRKAALDKDAQVKALQKQLAAAQNPADGASPSPSPAPGAAGTGAATAAGAPASSPQAEAIHRVAQQWSAMDPENAAALAQKLPDAYDAQVFAQMSPDNVGPIMDALPPAVAAKIVQAGSPPQLSAQPGR